MKNIFCSLIKLTIVLILFVIVICNSTSVLAEVLKEIKIVGATKTKDSALMKHIRLNVGTDVSEQDIISMKDRLMKIHQVIIKKIDFTNGTLTIEIEDKWSLFPVPMITQSGYYFNRGVLIYDNNFLGRLGTFAPAIAQTNSGLNGLLYFQDETLFSDQTGVKILALKKSDLTKFKHKGTLESSFESRFTTFMITPNYLWNDHVFKGGPFYINKEILNSDEITVDKRESVGLFFRHHYNLYTVMDVYFKGLETTYNYFLIKNNQNQLINIHEGDVKYVFSFAKDFLDLQTGGYFVNDSTYMYPKLIGGSEGNRGYDKSSVPANKNLFALIQYQKHIYDRIYFSPFYEYNIIKLIKPVLDGGVLHESSVGAGIRYYFKKISIPAIIFEGAHNIEDNSNHFHLNIGLGL